MAPSKAKMLKYREFVDHAAHVEQLIAKYEAIVKQEYNPLTQSALNKLYKEQRELAEKLM